MSGRRHDPTTVEARKAQSQQKLAHKIKLKKQLEKAQKKLGITTEEPKEPRYSEDDDEIQAPLGRREHHDKTSPTPQKPVHMTHKVDPFQEAKRKREDRIQQMKEEREAQERQARKIEREKKAKERSKRYVKQKLMAKTAKGQPRLSKHIDILLRKMQNKSK